MPKAADKKVSVDTKALAVHAGNKLYELRVKKNLSQRDLAAVSGVSCPYICQVENAEVSVSLNILYKLSLALGVKLDYWVRDYKGNE